MVIILMVLAILFSLSLYLWPDSVWLMKGDLEKVRSTAGIAIVIMFAGLLLKLW